MLFEGAQAVGLDVWLGTYPYVSSGVSAPVGAALGTGLPMQDFPATVIVAKTLPTRVGNGPMPSEMWERQGAMDFVKQNIELFTNKEKRAEFLTERIKLINEGKASNAEMSQYFQVLGDERGATTGRGRSVGFLDIPWLCYVARVTKPKYIALTRFDMLSGINQIPVVVNYELNGKILPPGSLPPAWKLGEVKPIFENWSCFSENIFGYNSFEKLPQAAQQFIERIEKLVGVPG
jgi:adenylosuccinate synthase